METKHTPEPWSVAEAGCVPGSLLVALGDADDYCRVVGNDCEANAALIAAAPDMLAALEGARAALVAYGAEGGATFKGVCAAIAKAKGGAA
jgi:hypothetical protein